MDYQLIYTIPFAALDGTPCVVEIEKEGYEGEATELQAGGTPFTVDIDDEDFLYTPLRFSTAKIGVVGGDYLQALFSTGYRQHRVTFRRGGEAVWFGFVKPELYTQDYSSDVYGLEVECVSAMSVLEHVEYEAEAATPGKVSLWRLLWKCVEASRAAYRWVITPDVYALSKDEYGKPDPPPSGDYQPVVPIYTSVLKKLEVLEQDFFDEEGKPMNLREVLGEVCKFLNWTCVDWAGSLYFVDIDHAGTFHKWELDQGDSPALQSPETLQVQDIGFAGAGHTLDILPGYNKVTVKCSNYPAGDIAKMDMDFSGLDVLAYPQATEQGNDVSKRLIMHPAKLGKNIELLAYEPDTLEPADPGAYASGPLDNDSKGANNLAGALPVKVCLYQMEEDGHGKWEPSINTYSYTDIIRVRKCGGMTTGDGLPAVRVKFPYTVYPEGAVCINGLFCRMTGSLDFLDTPEIGGNEYWPVYYTLRIGSLYYNAGNLEPMEKGWQEKEVMNHFTCHGTDDPWVAVPDMKQLDTPYGEASGVIIDIGDPKAGELELVLYGFSFSDEHYGLKDFRVSFAGVDGGTDDGKEKGEDRVYENVVNEDFVNPLDEIEFKISTYNEDGPCYGKVLVGGKYLEDTLYNCVTGGAKRAEELLVTRVVNHYASPLVKLTQQLRYDPLLLPWTRLTDTFQPGKVFINTGGSIDFRMGKFECKMVEI